MMNNKIHVSYKKGPLVTIEGDFDEDYLVEFINHDNNEKLFESTIKNNESIECDIMIMNRSNFIVTCCTIMKNES